jgi:cytochrome c peroxidase
VAALAALGAAFLALTAQTGSAPVPLGLTRVPHPGSNPWSPAKAELGRLLFFDPRLSMDGQVSCSSCHRPEHAFADPRTVSTGVRGRRTQRNAPSLVNRAYAKTLGWDGRSASLEAQALACLAQREAMDSDAKEAAARIAAVAGYQAHLKEAFGDAGAAPERLSQALAAFIRTLVSGNSPYDRFMAGEPGALSAEAARGKDLFFGRANCHLCHRGSAYSTDGYACVGVEANNPPDEGRFGVTRNPSEWRVFRIPGLREVTRTAPYFHDGSIATLEEAIEFYDSGGEIAENRDPRLKPLRLSAQDKTDLLAFLKALEGEGWQHARRPEKLPE